jgi:ABC-2 type transport system permease protein
MKEFIKVIEIHLKIFFQSKWGFFIYFAMRPIAILINIALFTSIYSYNGTDSIKSYSLNQMVWYFIANGFVWVFITNFADFRISRKIITGDLTMDLLRPISLFRFEFANAIALRAVGICMEFFPGMLIYSLIYQPKFLTLLSLLKFILLMIFAFILYYFINFLIGLLAFALNNNSSIIAIKVILFSIAGGAFIPLDFFPGWINRLFDLLPFKYIMYWPIQVFLNKESAAGVDKFLFILAGQLIWMGILYILCKISWNGTVKKFCVAGG